MEKNRKLVYDAIKSGKRVGQLLSISYNEIVKKTGLEYQTVSGCIRSLVWNKIIEKHSHKDLKNKQITNTYKILKVI
jgi:hypothetical protein